MGESCVEGGPYSSHKIPQEARTRKECSEQNFIHPSISHVIEKTYSSSIPSTKPPFAVCSSPSNVDVSSF